MVISVLSQLSGLELFSYKLTLKLLEKFPKTFISQIFLALWEILLYSRSNLPEMFCKNFVPKNFPKFTGKHMCWSFFFNAVKSWRPATFLKKTPTRVFSCEFCAIFKNTFFIEHLRWLLLDIQGDPFSSLFKSFDMGCQVPPYESRDSLPCFHKNQMLVLVSLRKWNKNNFLKILGW